MPSLLDKKKSTTTQEGMTSTAVLSTQPNNVPIIRLVRLNCPYAPTNDAADSPLLRVASTNTGHCDFWKQGEPPQRMYEGCKGQHVEIKVRHCKNHFKFLRAVRYAEKRRQVQPASGGLARRAGIPSH